ncbi:MAG: hypothetical protein ACRDZ8_19395 [Acidimicrobiales bacterium]
MVDLVLEPKGFERGYSDHVGDAVTVDVTGTVIRVGALGDLIAPNDFLGWEKDREDLPFR